MYLIALSPLEPLQGDLSLSASGALLKALQQDLDRNLSPEAAGVGFGGGQAAVLPEFVAAVATATEAEVFAVVLTALDTTVHIGQQPVELRRLRGCLQ